VGNYVFGCRKIKRLGRVENESFLSFLKLLLRPAFHPPLSIEPDIGSLLQLDILLCNTFHLLLIAEELNAKDLLGVLIVDNKPLRGIASG
jgi:hypothetical protein